MENKKSAKKRIFSIKHLPMDIGRIICTPLPLIFNIKKIYITDKARKKVRSSAIIAANHVSFADPLLIASSFWYRRMFYLAAETVMKNKFLKFLLKGIGCIEINRNICDMNAIRKVVSVLKSGHTVSIFPQGGIDREEDLSAIKSGIILMALQSKSPIIPVYVHKKEGFFDRNCIVIGEPIDLFSDDILPTMKDIQNLSDIVYNKMNECKEKYYMIKKAKK